MNRAQLFFGSEGGGIVPGTVVGAGVLGADGGFPWPPSLGRGDDPECPPPLIPLSAIPPPLIDMTLTTPLPWRLTTVKG